METVDALENTTLYAIADKTNLWNGETVSVGTLTFYNGVLGISIAEAVIILSLLFVLARLRTKPQRKQ